MTIYVFNEPGVIPGVPGTFSHCRVEVADDGTVAILPLAQYPLQPENGSEDSAQTVEPPDEKAASTIVPEQAVPPALNPNTMGG